MSYYAVHKGNNIGVFLIWDECKKSVFGYKGAIYKKFDNKEDAIKFVNNGYNSFNNLNNNILNEEECIYVYTDGSCINNGKTNAKAGYGIYFGENDIRNISKRINGLQTNNRAELLAIIETFNILKNEIENNKNIIICTDSSYSIKCCTYYSKKILNKKPTKKEVPNKDLLEIVFNLFNNKSNIKFKYIEAHTSNQDKHSIGNYHADNLAKQSLF